MKTLARIWDRLWFAPADPFSLALMRVSLGVSLLAFFLVSAPNWHRFYAPDGVNALDWHEGTWSLFYWTEGIVPLDAWLGLALVASVFLAVGWLTRASTVVLYLIESSMIHSAPQATNGEDFVFRFLLFYGMCAPLGACLSVDNVAFGRAEPAPEHFPAVWPTRLAQINVALVYLISLPWKLCDDKAWWDGSAIYYVMASATWSRWPWPSLFYGGLSHVSTWGTVVVEGAFPVLVWFRRPRPYVLAGIVALHASIAVVLSNVTFFNIAMLCSFWIFVPGESSRAAFARVSRSLGSKGH